MNVAAFDESAFLNGAIRIFQPIEGYRAATDPVLMAAAVPARPGQRVLDLGCGVGTAALCLGNRVADLDLHGLEIQPEYASLARRNADLNRLSMTVHQGDVAAVPAALRALVFDAVMLNPPWYPPEETPSPDAGRDKARRTELPVGSWIDAALSRLRQGGYLVSIQRIDRLAAIVTALDGPAGAIEILPLTARVGRDAKRVIVRARKTSRTPLRLASPLVLHDGTSHVRDRDDFSPRAAAILRDGAELEF